MHTRLFNRFTSPIRNAIAPFLVIVFCTTAQDSEPGLFFSQSIGASYNPLGIILDSRLCYKSPLVRNTGLLWKSTNIQAGIQNEWTPADNVASARFSIEPVAFFELVCKAGFYNMYNLFGYGCYRFASSANAYGPDVQRNLKPDNARGYWISVAPTIKAKFGRIIALNTLTISGLGLNGTGYFLEVRSYLPHRATDIDIADDAYLLAECLPWLMAGATYHYAYVLNAALRSQRLCTIAIVKQTRQALKSTYAAVTAGFYPQDPLFNHTFYIGCLVGADLRLSDSSKKKE